MDDLTIEQICMHYGENKQNNRGAVVTPIYQTANYAFGGDFEYSRGDAPNFDVVEKKIAALDHAKGAVMVSCGAAAINAVMLAALKSGDHVVSVDSRYVTGRRALNYMERFGITYTSVIGKTVEEFENAIRPNTRLIYLESPNSYVSQLQPLREVVALAKSKGILTCIDNTSATPLYQNPIDLGIDFVIYSASKYFGGHSDLLAGFVVCNTDEHIKAIKFQRHEFGFCSTPFNAFLVERGLRTLPARMPIISANSNAVARYLDGHKNIEKVFHPEACDYDQKELYKSQMRNFGGIFSFRSKDGTPEKYKEFLDRCRVFQCATSWGGHESLVAPLGLYKPLQDGKSFSLESLKGGVMRIYTGLENTSDLLNDLEQALRAFD